ALWIILAGLLAFGSALQARPDRTFTVTPNEQSEIRNFIRLLEEAHYNREAVTPANYRDVILDFMESWDAQHLFFLQSDYETFNATYGDGLYWNVSNLGDVGAG